MRHRHLSLGPSPLRARAYPFVAVIAGICFVGVGAGCGSKKPAKPASPAPKASTGVGVAATGAAPDPVASPPESATAAEAAAPPPRAATAAVAPPKRADSVALFFSDRGSADFALPTKGRTTAVRATAIDGGGRPITSLDGVAGAPLMLIAARTDLSWIKVLAPPKLNGDDGATHTFSLKFPQAGPHILLFVFQPIGAPRVVMPSYVKVKGARKPDAPPGGAQTTWKGSGGVVAKLLGSPSIDVCKPTWLATTWERRGKALKLEALRTAAERAPKQAAAAARVPAKPGTQQAPPQAPVVTYVALNSGARDVQILSPIGATARPAALDASKLPRRTAAEFTPLGAGSTAVLAIARVRGTPVIARFDVVVGGTLPKGGCPK